MKERKKETKTERKKEIKKKERKQESKKRKKETNKQTNKHGKTILEVENYCSLLHIYLLYYNVTFRAGNITLHVHMSAYRFQQKRLPLSGIFSEQVSFTSPTYRRELNMDCLPPKQISSLCVT